VTPALHLAAAPNEAYRAFLRSRWPARSRSLAVHAFVATFVLAALDLVFLSRVGGHPGAVARVRLPWAMIPVAGWCLQRFAPTWRGLPALAVALSLAWTWGNDWAYHAVGLDGSVLQAMAVAICVITSATFLPLRLRGRLAVFALMGVGHLLLDLGAHAATREVRLWTDLVLLAFVAVQTVVFENFAASQRRGFALRHELLAAVAALEASRSRAAASEEAVRKLAADVAHAVNSPLAAVKSNVAWLGAFAGAPEGAGERDEVVRDTLDAVQRIAVAVEGLRREQQDGRILPARLSRSTTGS